MNKPVIYLLGDGLVAGHLAAELANEYDVARMPEGARIRSIPPGIDLRDILRDMEATAGAPPAMIVNAIGVVGKPNVDWCEDHKEETTYANVFIPVSAAYLAMEYNVPFVHISTGCIFNSFDGHVFMPDEKPNFSGSHYSWTKMEAERMLRGVYLENKEAMINIHRIRMPFMRYPSERNLLDKLIKYETLVDAPNSITSLEDYAAWFAGYAFALLARKAGYYEIKHAVNKWPLSHREIVEFIRAFTDVPIGEKKYVTPQELNRRTRVPRSNCALGAEVLPESRLSLFNTIPEYAKHLAL